MRTFVFIVGDNGVPWCQTIAIPVAVYRFSSIFLDRLVFGGCLLLLLGPRAVKQIISWSYYFIVILPAGD